MGTKLLPVGMIRTLIVVNRIRSPTTRTHLHRFSLELRRVRIAAVPTFGNIVFPG